MRHLKIYILKSNDQLLSYKVHAMQNLKLFEKYYIWILMKNYRENMLISYIMKFNISDYENQKLARSKRLLQANFWFYLFRGTHILNKSCTKKLANITYMKFCQCFNQCKWELLVRLKIACSSNSFIIIWNK